LCPQQPRPGDRQHALADGRLLAHDREDAAGGLRVLRPTGPPVAAATHANLAAGRQLARRAVLSVILVRATMVGVTGARTRGRPTPPIAAATTGVSRWTSTPARLTWRSSRPSPRPPARRPCPRRPRVSGESDQSRSPYVSPRANSLSSSASRPRRGCRSAH